ncbi:MAG: AI-2E family transporter [Thermoguttaceae bacterium]
MRSTLRNEQIWLAVGSLMIIAAVALAAGLVYTKVVLVPFVLAVFLSTVVVPLVDFLVLRCKIPQSLAIVLALVLIVVFLSVFCMFLIGAVEAIVTTVGEYTRNFKDTVEGYTKSFKDSTAHIKWLKEWNDKKDYDKILSVVEERLPAVITQAVGTGTVLIASLIANGFLITFFVIFLLAGRDSRRKKAGLLKEIESAVRRYIITKFAISAVSGLLVWLILNVLGLRMASVFGLLAFLLNFIPNVGSIIATLLPLPMAVAQFDSVWPIIGVVAVPGTLQLVIGNAVEPKLLGRGLELHPVTILLALAFWGLLWGYIGMVLAVPITAIIRIILIRYDTTRAMGNLLGGKLPG